MHKKTHRTRVKICGICNLDDAQAAVEAGADALGFNFWKPGKRYIEPDQALEIVKTLPPFVSSVGVFVEASVLSIRAVVEQVGLHVIQIHDITEPDRYEPSDFEGCLGAPVLPVVRPENREDMGHQMATLGSLGVASGTILMDTPSRDLPGGTGRVFDWSVAESLTDSARVILGGGLHPGNVADAVRQVRPYAVDVASGVEVAPGKKDYSKMRDFILAVREADGA